MYKLKKIFKNIDLTEGTPWKVILTFAIPIFLSLLLTNAFTLINALVLKATVGGDSVSAVNSTTSISNIMFQFAYGVSGGFAIIIAEHAGKKDNENLKKTFYNAIYLCIIIAFCISVIGLIFYKELFEFLNINIRYLDKAQSYYKLILLSFVFMLLSNYFFNVLRAMGDSTAPLVISIVGTIVNITFAFLLTGVIKLDTKGVAISTLLANLTNSVISYIYIMKKYSFMRGKMSTMEYSTSCKLLKLGIPLGIQWSILFVGSFFQDRSINSFGDGLATKAASCYNPFGNYLTIPISAVSNAALNYVAQNYGIRDFNRINRGVKNTVVIHFITWIVVMIIGFSLLNKVPYIFLPKDEVNDLIEGPIIKYYCSTYLTIIISSLIMQGLLTLSRSYLQGIQKTFIVLISGIGELLARVFVCTFIPSIIDPVNPLSDKAFVGICFSTPFAWFVSMVIMGGAVLYYTKKNKIKNLIN